MPTVAATLTLNVPAITGLVANATINTIVSQISNFSAYYGQAALTSLTANSANWQSTYSTVYSTSAYWTKSIVNLGTTLSGNSGTWNSTYYTLSSLSGNWNNTLTTLSSNSANWQYTYNTVTTNLTTWNATGNANTTVITNSAGWTNTETTVYLNSGSWNPNIGGYRGPYSVINTSTIIPVSSVPYGYGGNYSTTLGGINNTNSGNYNVLGGGIGNYISGGCYNFIGTGGYNHIGGAAIAFVNNIKTRSNAGSVIGTLSGNGKCTGIIDNQGAGLTTKFKTGDTVGVIYTTTNNPSLTSINNLGSALYSTCATVISVISGSGASAGCLIIGGSTGTTDFSYCTQGSGNTASLSANSLYIYDQSLNQAVIGNTIGGGILNTSSGNYGTVGGGLCNAALNGSAIVGGTLNTSNGCNSFIGGGNSNIVNTSFSYIGGGSFNAAGAYPISYAAKLSAHSSGCCTAFIFNTPSVCSNFNQNDIATIFLSTTAAPALSSTKTFTAFIQNITCNSSCASVVVPGNFTSFGGNSTAWVYDQNIACCGAFNTIGGGVLNTASGCYSTIAGGVCNAASNTSTIGGGIQNIAGGLKSFIGGGICNFVNANCATVVGGQSNNAYANYSFTGGGWSNSTSGIYSFIGGGLNNVALSAYSAVVGGSSNYAQGCYSIIGGGLNNTASGYSSFVGGGICNTASGNYGTIAGGSFNVIPTNIANATIAGGYYNYACGLNSFVAGGSGNNVCGANSFALGSNLVSKTANYTFVNNLSSQGTVVMAKPAFSTTGTGALGTFSKRISAYDANGTYIGYIPVYL